MPASDNSPDHTRAEWNHDALVPRVHRDLKSQNIVLGDFGETILLDWGLAKFVDEEDNTRDSKSFVLADEEPAAPPVDMTRQSDLPSPDSSTENNCTGE